MTSLSLGKVTVEFMHQPSASVWLLELQPSTSRWALNEHHQKAVRWLKSCCFALREETSAFKRCDYILYILFSGLCSGKWHHQLCSQWAIFDILWLLPWPLWRRVSGTLWWRKLVRLGKPLLFISNVNVKCFWAVCRLERCYRNVSPFSNDFATDQHRHIDI